MTSGEHLPDDLDPLRRSLVSWYDTHHRSLPWRSTTDPYPILVAEVMSQQTQLDRVIEPFERFVDRWPTVDALANTMQRDVVAFWTEHALGYNSRARYLHEAAKRICEVYNGTIPADIEELQTLPGVGPYTANAVASFAFNDGDAVIDTNVKRILFRAFDVPDDETEMDATANKLMPTDDSRTWNNAIMELGGLVCTSTPHCDERTCPWRRWCAAYRTGDFSAPDVAAQTTFDGSRRQYRGRIIRALATEGPLQIDRLGRIIRVDYEGQEADRKWLSTVLRDLENDGLVSLVPPDDPDYAQLAE